MSDVTVETTVSGTVATVVVPIRNAAAYLPILLAALEGQTISRDRFEVVLADDGSTDGSTDGLESDDGWIRVVRGPAVNAYAGRNRAARVARTPVVAFCDADCRPEPDWLESGLAALERADLVAGRIRFMVPPHPSIWSLLDVEMTKDHELQVRLGVAETANLFVRRDVFEQLGGFDDRQPGYGDYEFVSRSVANGARLAYEPRAVVWHPTRDEGLSFLRNLWSMNASYAAYETRAGRRPLGLRIRSWIPIVQTARARRRFGLSMGPDRRCLRANGISPRLSDDLRALPIIYIVIPYLRCFAQIQGWRDGLRARRALVRDS